jgi:tetratricopeptide (TPR) repeat protein
MKQLSSPVFRPLRLLTLAAALSFAYAHADEYTDVSQLVRSGKLSEALTKVEQHLANKPRDPQMRFLKGVIQRDSGKTNDAITTFSRLTEDYPELPEPYNNLAVLYAGQSQFDKARTALEMAIRTNPSYATAHENLGDVYAKLASQAYAKALQLDTGNQGVQPKLTLIRELINPTGVKTQRPTSTNNASPTPAPTAAVTPSLPSPTPAATPSPTTTVTTAQLPTPSSTPSPAPDSSTTDAENAVHAWAKAWSARDVKGYLAAYGKDFVPPGKMSRSTWEDERRQRITSKSAISVKLENLQVSVNGNKAVAKFRQDYRANGLQVTSRKTLDLMKSGERWLIVKESTGN